MSNKKYESMSIDELRKLATKGWFRSPDINAIYQLGCLYESGDRVAKDEHEAVSLYRQGADSGHVNSQRKIGECYLQGKGVTKSIEDGVEWLIKAARSGDRSASRNLTEHGISQKMCDLLAEAKIEGNYHSQFELAEMYRTGEGAPLDLNRAAYWFRKSADYKNEYAYIMLGEIYSSDNDIQNWTKPLAR